VSAQTLPVPPQAPAAVATEAASGVPLFVFAFGFSVIALSLANAGLVDASAGLFVPVAFGTGAQASVSECSGKWTTGRGDARLTPARSQRWPRHRSHRSGDIRGVSDLLGLPNLSG
jgi:hypothetical protein